jgi:hypothetical protein
MALAPVLVYKIKVVSAARSVLSLAISGFQFQLQERSGAKNQMRFGGFKETADFAVIGPSIFQLVCCCFVLLLVNR